MDVWRQSNIRLGHLALGSAPLFYGKVELESSPKNDKAKIQLKQNEKKKKPIQSTNMLINQSVNQSIS